MGNFLKYFCQLIVNCEELSADEVEAMLHCDESVDIIFHRGYCMDQIFNENKTDLN